jgi:ATP-dependent helicase/DNAse subunit B
MTDAVENVEVEVQESTNEDLKEIRAEFLKALNVQVDSLEEIPMDDVSQGPWSHSKLKVLEKCPLQYLLKYVMKAKLPVELSETQDTTQTDIGSAAHRILELVLTGHAVADSYKTTKTEFVPEKLSEEVWVEYIESVEYNIVQFKDRIDNFKQRHKVKKIYTELRLGVTRDWKPTKFFASDVWFRGVIDCLIVLENGDCLVIDWKYGAVQAAGLRHYLQQLHTYLPLINYGLRPISGGTTGIGYIKEGGILLDDFKEKADIEGKLKTSIEWNVEGALESVKEAGLFEHRVGSHCKWCDYAGLCKAKKADGNLRSLEAKTKKFFEIKRI